MMVKELYLMRHGQTHWNAARRIQGNLNSDLTPEGEAHALAVAELVQGRGIEVLYCSDLGRARQTASFVGEKLGLEPLPRRELRECNWGQWDGWDWDSLHETHGELMTEREEKLYTFRPPDGESYRDAENRVRPFLESLAKEHPDTIVGLVAHSMVNRMILKTLLGLSFEEAIELRQDHLEVIHIVFDGQPRIERLTAGSEPTGYKID